MCVRADFCTYDLMMGDLFVLSCARVGRVFLLWCLCDGVEFYCLSLYEVFCDHGGGYCCEVGVYVLFRNGVSVCANVCVYLVLLNVVCFLSLGICWCTGCDGCFSFCLVCDACSLRCTWSGIMFVAPCMC